MRWRWHRLGSAGGEVALSKKSGHRRRPSRRADASQLSRSSRGRCVLSPSKTDPGFGGVDCGRLLLVGRTNCGRRRRRLGSRDKTGPPNGRSIGEYLTENCHSVIGRAALVELADGTEQLPARSRGPPGGGKLDCLKPIRDGFNVGEQGRGSVSCSHNESPLVGVRDDRQLIIATPPFMVSIPSPLTVVMADFTSAVAEP
jgi:hypothetical protein